MMHRRTLLSLGLATTAAAAALLAGCAAMNQLTADVSSFGEWPAGRAPGSFAFERLPSQEALGEPQQQLESAAGAALQRAGFHPVAAGAEPEVLVQVGARVSRTDRSPWDDPLWWHGGYGHWRSGPWRGGGWGLGMRLDSPRWDHEVALLLRDRASGKPLYETRASSEGYSIGSEALLEPLFNAALRDFPATGLSPRQVTVPLGRGTAGSPGG